MIMPGFYTGPRTTYEHLMHVADEFDRLAKGGTAFNHAADLIRKYAEPLKGRTA